jgi:hypothetical protein
MRPTFASWTMRWKAAHARLQTAREAYLRGTDGSPLGPTISRAGIQVVLDSDVLDAVVERTVARLDATFALSRVCDSVVCSQGGSSPKGKRAT